MKGFNLRIPGPTPLAPEVREALSQEMISHRGPEFAALFREVGEGLKRVFQTQNDVLIFTASGTGGMEAALVNTLSPGDRALVIVTGFFGERWLQIAQACGVDAVPLRFPLGKCADPEEVRRTLKASGPYRAVLVTHNETSTGITNDLRAIAQAVHSVDEPPLLLVDAVSSLGAIDLRTDEWGCDVVVTASQKALMAPPGLALISVSPRAWQAAESARLPRFYWDFRKMREYAAKAQTPFTPAVTTLLGLREALRRIEDEGLEEVFARHHRVGKFTREGVKSLGLQLFPDEACASDTVTAVRVPEGVEADEEIRRLHDEYGIVISGGQGPLKGKIFRIGHMGYVQEEDIQEVLGALKEVIR